MGLGETRELTRDVPAPRAASGSRSASPRTRNGWSLAMARGSPAGTCRAVRSSRMTPYSSRRVAHRRGRAGQSRRGGQRTGRFEEGSGEDLRTQPRPDDSPSRGRRVHFRHEARFSPGILARWLAPGRGRRLGWRGSALGHQMKAADDRGLSTGPWLPVRFCLPLPRFGGEGWGEGAAPQAQAASPPHPNPLPRKAGGEGVRK